MATRKLKSNGYVKQLNLNDTVGELIQSFNIDLKESVGKIKLAYPLKKVANSTLLNDKSITGFGVLSANNGTVYAITDSQGGFSKILSSQKPYTSWTDVTDGAPSNLGDATVFGGQLVVAESTDLGAFDGSDYTSGWWTDRGNPALGTFNTNPHILETLYIGAETLVVTDGNEVHAYTGGIDSGAVVSVTVELGGDFLATCLKPSIRRVWIGTMTEDSNEARVFEWDGASTNYTQSYPVGTKGVLAMEIVNDTPLIITDTGEIKMFNNVGFTTVAQFPFAFKPHTADGILFGDIEKDALLRPIHPKGIKKVGNIVYIMVNWKDDDLPIDEKTPAGLWTLDLTTYSLTHLSSPDNQQIFEQSAPILAIEDGVTRLFTGGKLLDGEVGIWIEDLGATNHYGHFTSVEIESDSIEDSFNQIVIKALLGTSDSVVVKYRGENDVLLPINFTGTWLTSNQINTTFDLSHALTRFTEGHYDEVEITSGSGSGRLAHITDISASSGTYQITLDETIGTAGESATARIDNWIKIPERMTQADGEVKRLGIGEVSSWVQVKVEMRGKSGYPEIREIQLLTNNKQGK
jgi:hypothetical protein